MWRLRVYKAEKVVGAAKPILFLVKKLVLESGQCQRVLWAAYCLPTFRWRVKSIPTTTFQNQSGILGEVQLCYNIIDVKLLAQKWGSGDCLQTHLEPAEHVTQVHSTLFDNINVWTKTLLLNATLVGGQMGHRHSPQVHLCGPWWLGNVPAGVSKPAVISPKAESWVKSRWPSALCSALLGPKWMRIICLSNWWRLSKMLKQKVEGISRHWQKDRCFITTY